MSKEKSAKNVLSEKSQNVAVVVKVKEPSPLQKRIQDLKNHGGAMMAPYVDRANALMGDVAAAEKAVKDAKKRVRKALKAGEQTLEAMDDNYAAMRAAAKAERAAAKEAKGGSK